MMSSHDTLRWMIGWISQPLIFNLKKTKLGTLGTEVGKVYTSRTKVCIKAYLQTINVQIKDQSEKSVYFKD